MADRIYDLIIIGAGPAGLSAAIYAGRATLDTLVLEADTVGGQVTTTAMVYNYPATPAIDGTKLMHQMQQQTQDFGVAIKKDRIVKFDLDGDVKILTGESGHQYQTRSVIIATGASPRHAGFIGEDEFRGRGIAYCSTCDGELFTGLEVFVVGGGYTAAEEADFLTRYAKHVTVLVREGEFQCPPLTAARALDNPKVDVKYHTEIKEVRGDQYLTEMTLVNNETKEETVYHVDDGDQTFGVFVYVGTKPATDELPATLEKTPQGYLKVSRNGETALPGVYAAGDVIDKKLRQIITAAADGATAAMKSEEYVSAQKKRLNIPINRPKPKSVGKTSSVVNERATKHTGKWFAPDLVSQLSPIFARLTKPVTLKVLSTGNELSHELISFVQELAGLDGHLTETTVDAPADLDYAPQLRLVVDGQETGLQYAGVPTGHELNSLVLGLYNVAGPGQEVAADLINRIKQLPATKIEIGVSLACHFCPDVVAACQKMASINPNITATMIDLAHFKELREERQIMSVPATMINGGPVIFGSQTLEQLVTAAEKAK